MSRRVRCVLVSHFHWDREWYRTFEAYRARLVDAVDRVLELLARRSRLSASCSTGRRSCSRTTWRSGRSAATSWRGRSRAGGSPSGRGTCSPTRCCRRARRTCATCWTARPPRRRVRPGVARRATCPTRSATRRSSRSSSPASASATFVYWRGNGERDRRPRSGVPLGWRPTAAPCAAHAAARRLLQRRLPSRRRRTRRRGASPTSRAGSTAARRAPSC